MFECVARPRYIPGHGWVTLENADTPDLGAEVNNRALAQQERRALGGKVEDGALTRARQHARALAQLQNSAQHPQQQADASTQTSARDTREARETHEARDAQGTGDARDSRDGRAGAPAFAPTPA